jgi:hypothetical protein
MALLCTACVCGCSLTTPAEVSQHEQAWSQCKGRTAACPCEDPNCAHGKDCPHPECRKSFRDNGTSKIHFLTHLPEAVRPKFTCTICRVEYRNRKDWKAHQRKKHEGLVLPQGDSGTAIQGPSSATTSLQADPGLEEDVVLAQALQDNTDGGFGPDNLLGLDLSLAQIQFPEQPNAHHTHQYGPVQQAQPFVASASSAEHIGPSGAETSASNPFEAMMSSVSNQGRKRAAEDVLDHGRANAFFIHEPEEPAIAFQMDWTSEEQKKYDWIIKCLDFTERESRLAMIRAPSEGTSNWIFEPTADSKHEFPKWLESDSGVFLILGKAGSGKSTLLKHIVHHKECEILLARWATVNGFQHELITATCYFWRAGSDMQKKKEGLYRSLLGQILERRRDLTPIALPNHWARQYHRDVEAERQSWDVGELKKALFRAVEHNALLRFCFFIDGLDEYSDTDDIRELVQDLESLSKVTNVKICITSRPSALRNFFEKRPRLNVEEFTKSDIQKYVKLKLESNDRFQKLRLKDTERAEEIIWKIHCRSEGVFLWIYLVTERLVTDLEYMGTLIELESAVKLLPPGMEKLLDDTMKRVEPEDRMYTARLLLLMLGPNTNLEVGRAYCLIEEHENPPSVFGRDVSALVGIQEDELDDHVEDLSEYSIKSETRVKRWCHDLVEIREEPPSWKYPAEEAMRWPIGGNKTVRFAHRTVYDYVEKHHQVFAQHEGSTFDVRRAKCRVLLLWLRKYLQAGRRYDRSPEEWTRFISHIVSELLDYAADLDMALEEGDQTASVVLNSMNHMLSSCCQDGPLWPFLILYELSDEADLCRLPLDVQSDNHWILILSTSHGLSNFFQQGLTQLSQQSPELCAQICPYILLTALDSFRYMRYGCPLENRRHTIKILANHFAIDMSAKIRFKKRIIQHVGITHTGSFHQAEDSIYPDEIVEVTFWAEFWSTSLYRLHSGWNSLHDLRYDEWKSEMLETLRLLLDVGALRQQPTGLPLDSVYAIAEIFGSDEKAGWVRGERVIQDLLGMFAELNLDTTGLQDQWARVQSGGST